MIQKGYMLVQMMKTLNIYLWAETVEDLTKDLTEKELKQYKVVPYYKDGNKEYIKYSDKMYRIG